MRGVVSGSESGLGWPWGVDKGCCLCADREPAWKHGIDDADIAHAVRNAMRWIEMDDDLTMLIGPAADAGLVGVLDIDGEDPVVIHAMPLRRKFYRFLA